MKEKKIFMAMLVLLITAFAICMYFALKIEIVNVLSMPLLFCISKLLERLGWSLYHSSYETDLIGLVVMMVALVVLLVYDWREITYWILIGTVVTFFGVLISRKLYHRKK